MSEGRTMRIVVVNPNTTASMTARIGAAAQAAAFPGTEVIAINPARGPASIEGPYDGALAVPGMLGLIEDHATGTGDQADAFVIACFDDTGLDAARCVARAPVLGIGEAAFHAATLVAHRFSVITTLSRSVAGIEDNLRRYGLAARCGRVRASEVPVLDLEHAGSGARDKISAEIAAALAEDGADAIVLGCAGMTDLADALAQDFGVPVIDGVVAAVKFAEALVSLGLATSKRGPYAFPRAK